MDLRELASQIHEVLLKILAFHPASSEFLADSTSAQSAACIKPLLLLGGNTSPAHDLKNFLETSPNFLIGTPGRLNELLSSPHVHTSSDSFEALILDEADRLLDLGFKETLSKIISRLPKQRRTGLFSATISDAIVGSLVRAGLRNPVKVVVKVRGIGASASDERRAPASLQMTYLLAPPSHRLALVPTILAETTPQKAILYFSNCASVDYFAPLFQTILAATNGRYAVVPLHGKQAPSTRTKNFKKFADCATPALLLTTDLAARGLDVPSVDLVLQIDAPTDPKSFLHRCGRAGRAGRRGLAILFLTPGREEGYIDFLHVRKTPVTEYTLSSFPPTQAEVIELTNRLRKVVLSDRAIYEKGMKAFVSHVRALSKHQTTSIFRVQDIDFADLAMAYALLRVPRMPETKGTEIELHLEAAVDTNAIAYKDQNREQIRQREIAEGKGVVTPEMVAKRKKEVEEKKKRNSAWSEKVENVESKQERKERKRKRKEAEKLAGMGEEERRKEEEWRELVETVKKRKLIGQTVDDEEEFTGLD